MSEPDSESLWQQFLQSIYDDNFKTNEEEEEEVNDPEYSISEDLLKLDDDWDFRDERAFKVSDYELDLLLDEDENEMEVETVETVIKSTENTDVFDQKSVGLLVSQLSQHIQLLTQTYFQSFNTNGLQSVAKNADSMLNEINDISKTNPLFASINISSSIQLISKYPINKSCQTSRSMTSWRTLPVTKEIQRIYISNEDVFPHSWLLPFCGFCGKEINKNKSKTSFTLAEDHLIALGLEQFSPLFSLRKCYRYLKQLLLPTKTVDQIRTHIKNIKRRSNTNENSENPIIYYYQNGRAPTANFGQTDCKSESNLLNKTTPEWYTKALKTKFCRKDNRKSDIYSDPKKSKMSPNIVSNDKKKYFVLPLQSPVKQTNSIVKKYKYLNRLNQLKQSLSVISNSNSKTKKQSNCETDFTQINNYSDVKSCQNTPKVTETSVTNENITNNMEVSVEDNSHKTYKSDKDNQMIITNNECNEGLNDISINEEDAEYDDESDLAALMTASSTITTKIKNKSKTSSEANNCSVLQLNQSKKEGRKSLAVKQRESTLQLLSFKSNEIDSISHIKEDLLIQNFLEKVRKSLRHESYIHFLTLLSDFHQKRKEESFKCNSIKDIFIQIEDFLKQSNVSKEIISEFVLFLNAEQAEECGKMFEYLYWKRVFNFVSKLEKYSQIDGQCLSRFYRSLNQLKSNFEKCDENRIQWTVNRCLNGHSYLMHHFSSLLLESKPSEYLFEDQDFDEMVIDSSDDEERTDSSEKMCFETINIPESDDDLKFGTNECPCSTCHREDNQTITRHCTSCSIRFIGGRVYLTQNHKKLCLAEIHFSESDNNGFDANKINENIEDMGTESDKEIDFENYQISDKTRDKKSWTISDDKMLLELCRSKVLDEKHNDLSEDIFEEVADKLSKDTNEVISRFNKLMELFASEQTDSHSIRTQIDS